MILKRFLWWFGWGVASAAFLLIVLKGAGLSLPWLLLILLVAGTASGTVAVFLNRLG